jgi:hypothetical protein
MKEKLTNHRQAKIGINTERQTDRINTQTVRGAETYRETGANFQKF